MVLFYRNFYKMKADAGSFYCVGCIFNPIKPVKDFFKVFLWNAYAIIFYAKIRSGNTSLTELSDYALSLGSTKEPASGRQEGLEAIINSILFG